MFSSTMLGPAPNATLLCTVTDSTGAVLGGPTLLLAVTDHLAETVFDPGSNRFEAGGSQGSLSKIKRLSRRYTQ